MTLRHPEDDPQKTSEDRIQAVQRRSEEVKRLMEEVLRHPSLDALTLLEEEERFQRCDLVAALLFLGRTLGDILPPECLRGPLYTASAKLVILEEMDPEGLDASLAVHRAGAWCVVGLTCHLGADPEAAEAAYLQAARLYTGTGHRIERGTLCFLLGKLRHDTLRHDEALALLGRAVSIFEEAAGEEVEAEAQEAWLSALLGIGKIHLEEGDPHQALPALAWPARGAATTAIRRRAPKPTSAWPGAMPTWASGARPRSSSPMPRASRAGFRATAGPICDGSRAGSRAGSDG